jgi:hypothetical protein
VFDFRFVVAQQPSPALGCADADGEAPEAKMKAAAVTLSVLIACVGQCYAQDQSGNDISELCQIASRGPKTDFETAKATYCQGFVKAILFIGRRLDEPDSFCSQTGVTVGQAIDVFLKYLNDNPDKTHQPAESLAIAAFRKAWPCK